MTGLLQPGKIWWKKRKIFNVMVRELFQLVILFWVWESFFFASQCELRELFLQVFAIAVLLRENLQLHNDL